MKHKLLLISLSAIFLSFSNGFIPKNDTNSIIDHLGKSDRFKHFQSVKGIILPLKAQALTVEQVPNSRETNGGWVTDMANILDNKTEQELNNIITYLEADNGTEIAVVTVPDTQPSPTPKQFATELFNYWGIGKKGEDNGILFLISVGDRRVEIETGYGIESILPDAKVGEIIDNKITPQFKKGYYNLGTLEGTKALSLTLQRNTLLTPPEQVPPPSIEDSSDNKIPWGLIIFTGGSFLIIVGSVRLMRLSKKLKEERRDNAFYRREISESNYNVQSLESELKKFKDNKPIFIKPSGYTKKLLDTNNGHRPLYCSKCREALQRVDDQTLQSYLSKPQKMAEELKTAKFQGWGCFNCNLKNPKLGIHIFREKLPSRKYKECPRCKEVLVTETTKIVKQSTYTQKGEKVKTKECHGCNYSEHETIKLPYLTPPVSSYQSSSSGGSSSSSSSSSNSSSRSSNSYHGGYSSGSSSSSSSYGGGSSGGGGAGGGW